MRVGAGSSARSNSSLTTKANSFNIKTKTLGHIQVTCAVLQKSTQKNLEKPALKHAAGGLYVEMMGLIGAGNNPMVGMTVAVAVSIEPPAQEGKF